MPLQIIERIPKMKMRDLMSLWGNAVKFASDRDDQTKRQQGREVLDAIGQEWRKRKGLPIEEMQTDFFNWPSTEASNGQGGIDVSDWPQEGMLKFMGYHVGSTEGLTPQKRQAILAEIFYGELPPVFQAPYLVAWGDPQSAARLQKMAETLAAFIRNSKRRKSSTMDRAIKDWTEDLEFLYWDYYVEKFHFVWPDIDA